MTAHKNNVVDFGFAATLDERKARLRVDLALLPKGTEQRKVAEGVKNQGADFQDVYVDWASSVGFGRYKARHLWEKVNGDPDAWQDIFDDIQAAQKAGAERKCRFTPLTGEQLAELPPLQWCMSKVLPAEGIAALYGPSGSGKSFLALELGCAIAAGERVFGYATKQSPVLYIALEGAGGIRNRAEGWKVFHQCDRLPEDFRVLLPTSFRLTDPRDVQVLAAVMPKGCIVIIDTLNRAAPEADENSSKDVGRMIEGAKLLQQLSGGLVVLVAHTGKDTSKGLRGHSSMFAALDAAIMVERDFDTHQWKVDKAKDGKDGVEHRFTLAVVPVGEDESSCAIAPDDAPRSRERPLTPSQKKALESFHAAMKEFESPQVHLNNWRKVFYRMSGADGDEAKKKAFQRARNELIDAGKLAVEDNIYRLAEAHAAITELCVMATAGNGTGQGQLGDMSRAAALPSGTNGTDTL